MFGNRKRDRCGLCGHRGVSAVRGRSSARVRNEARAEFNATCHCPCARVRASTYTQEHVGGVVVWHHTYITQHETPAASSQRVRERSQVRVVMRGGGRSREGVRLSRTPHARRAWHQFTRATCLAPAS